MPAVCALQVNDLSTLAILALVTLDKITGNLVEDALATVQCHWLATSPCVPTAAAVGNLGRQRWCPATVMLPTVLVAAVMNPVGCQSLAEIADAVMGTVVKVVVDATTLSPVARAVVDNIHLVIPALTVYAVAAHWLMARQATSAKMKRL